VFTKKYNLSPLKKKFMLRRSFAASPSAFFGARNFVATSSTVFSQTRSVNSPGLDFLLNPTPEHAALRETCARFAKETIAPQAREFDIKGELNRELFNEAASLGLTGITVPAEDGGAGMDATAACIVHHEFSKYDPGFCLAYLAHTLLFVNNMYYSATAEQRAKYLPKVLSGEWLAGMGMSEPGAGTDVLGMKTTAKLEGDHYILNGGKTWITNAPTGDVFLVYAKNVTENKITSFFVERGMEGFSSGPKIDKLGMRGSQMGPLYFDNVKVPVANVVGGNTNGVVHMMRNLEIERLALAAMSVGIADQCVDYMIKYANERHAFGKPIANYGQIQKHIAEGFAKSEAAKTLVYSVARSVAPGSKNRIGTDAAKLFAAPVGKEVADSAIQVMGGMGYSRDMPVERLWRDAKLLEIGGGTNESHHKNLVKDLSAAYK
jgi:isovaleryl-CoA dehydrogenase